MRRPTRAELQAWYAEIKKADPMWVDIEGGRDLAQMPGSTFPGGDGSRGAAFVSSDILDFVEDYQTTLTPDGGPVMLRDHPTAEYWRAAAKAANDLPPSYRGRSFILDAIDMVDITAAGRRHRFKKDAAHRIWKKFVTLAGLPLDRGRDDSDEGDERHPPSPRLQDSSTITERASRPTPPGPRRIYTLAEAKAETRRRDRESSKIND